MRVVFWTNVLSPHQLPYICKLPDDNRVDEVIIVAGETVNKARRQMGWELGLYPGLEHCKVYIKPHDKIIESLFEKCPKDSVHLFSGIRGFAFVFKCLQVSMRYNVRRGIISESPNTFAMGRGNMKPLWLHRLRFLMQDRKYAKRLDLVFAMGQKATKYFNTVNRGWKVFPFMYCTQPSGCDTNPVRQDAATKFLFVGSLSYWKAPRKVSDALARCVSINKSYSGGVKFIGDGELRPTIEKFVKRHGLEKRVQIVGFKPQNEIPMWMAQNDILILPSIYDGWGAVVNEALQAGMYVIVSDACGASDLIIDKRIGQVFHHGNSKELANIMLYCDNHINEIRDSRNFRKQWADKHICGRVIAKYMVDCLTDEKMDIPWKI